ncbi:MAG: hypothetical protein JSV04_01870 [Candidatus Heimdallarchaeota archaeon]|nr:MAG: hypothetical protein JSV04_01870 [Candidatus Heimdallarchaeota archaeon]
MQRTDKHDLLTEPKPNSLFSFVFAFSFLLIIQLSPLFVIIYNFLIFPFTLIHEISHCIALRCFFPGNESQIKFHLFDNGISCGNVEFETLPICWGAIISILIGPLMVLIIGLSGIVWTRKHESNSIKKAGNQFFKFLLLCEIPNLFPIHPPLIGAATDGYITTVYLFLMGHTPFVSSELSMLLFGIASIISFTAFYYLGSVVYILLVQSKEKVLSYNRDLWPQLG